MPSRTLRLSLAFACFTTVAAAQVADFAADVTSGCFPLTVNFTDTSTGTPTGWEWDFGNGNSSPLQYPSAVYSAPGMYTVSLKASKDVTSNTKTKTAFIKVYGPPEIDFSFDISSGCAPLSVNFNDQTSTNSGTLTNWFWVFGDGGTSQSPNPAYIFQHPGSKTVSLKVRNQHGCEQTKVLETPIDVRGPVTEFRPASSAICTLPAVFDFVNNSTGQGAMTYEWNFGDGNGTTGTDVSHTYQAAGSYDVTLTTHDESDCPTTVTHKIYAGIDGGIDFTTAPSPACPGQELTFIATSVDPISSYQWTFGNGVTSTQISPKTTFEESRTYEVTLTAQLLNHACMSVVTKPVKIIPPAVPSFIPGLDCDLNLKLVSTATYAERIEWYINDILLSTSEKFISPIHLPGDQTVRLVAYSAAGCAYEKVETFTLLTTPTAHFTPNELFTCKPDKFPLAGCAPFEIDFVNTSTAADGTTWYWIFGDGATSTQKNPSHVYTTAGTYQVTLFASNANACSTFEKATVKVSSSPPLADFAVNKTLACPGEVITFTDKSSGALAWCWDFGDGWLAEGKNVIHQYSLPGTYSVTLTAKNGCNGVVTRTNLITIKNPAVTFTYSKTCEDPFDVQLTNLSSNFDELLWDFGDGQTSAEFDVGSHHYATEGSYELKLIGTSSATGCTVIAFAPITIQQVTAEFAVNTAKPCVGLPVTFTDQSHAAVKWKWSLGPFASNQQYFGATLFTPGDYFATLEVKDSDSCVAVKTVPIQVINMNGDFSYTAASTCDEFIVEFTDESTGIPAPTSWQWDFGDGLTSTDRNPLHAYADEGSYNVVLSISNAEGSCSFTKYGAVNFSIPHPDFASEKSTFCAGDVVTLANTSGSGSLFKWQFGDGRTSDLQSPEIVFNLPGSYSVTLFTTDEYGCQQQITKPDFIIVVQPIADFSVDHSTGFCPPFTASFQDKSSGDISTWLWDFDDGHTSYVQHPVNIYSAPGNFNVTLGVTDVYGCSAFKEVPQFVTVGGPSGWFNAMGWGSCDSQEVTFQSGTINAAKLTWDFGDGVVFDQLEGTSLAHDYNSTGTFTPSLLLTDANGCKVLAVAANSPEIIIKDTPVITTSIEPVCVYQGDPLRLVGEAKKAEALLWIWTIDGVEVGESDHAETSVAEPGVHTVTATSMNEFACAASMTTTIRVQGSMDMVPNVFTPNTGDLLNQTFTFEGLKYSEWDFGVIDRWGKQVYEQKNYRGNWDGNDLPAGVYYFVLRNVLCEGEDYKGVVSVVR